MSYGQTASRCCRRIILVSMVTGSSGTFGGFFDTAWHRTIGRDSFFILPHLSIYGAVIAIALAVLATGILVSQNPGVFAGPHVRLGRISLLVGFAIMGISALTTKSSAPVDE